MLRRLVLGALALQACCLDGPSDVPEQNPPQRRVGGVVGGTASFHARIPPGKAPTQIEWDFQPERSLALVIAEFTRGTFTRPNPEDRFQQRLEKAGNTTLRLRGLTEEDGGVYTAHVRFENAEVQEQKFLLVVSDNSRGVQTRRHFTWLLIIVMLLPVIFLLRKQLFRKIKPYLNRLRLRTSSAQNSNTPDSLSGTEPREGLAQGFLQASPPPSREETA